MFSNPLQTTAGGTTLVLREYDTYNGNLLKLTYGNGAYIRYTYDSQDRVAQTYYKAPGSTSEVNLNTHTYDGCGNMTSRGTTS